MTKEIETDEDTNVRKLADLIEKALDEYGDYEGIASWATGSAAVHVAKFLLTMGWREVT